ncbi:hypothetical protein M5D96_002137, partial [Drosophila gunungcola]
GSFTPTYIGFTPFFRFTEELQNYLPHRLGSPTPFWIPARDVFGVYRNVSIKGPQRGHLKWPARVQSQ